MNASFGKVQPDIIFSSLTGPGVCLPSRSQLWKDLIIVVSYPSFVYLGFPEFVPQLDKKKILNQAKADIIPAIGSDIRDIVVMSEDEYLKTCFNGDFWMIYASFSPVSQSFGAEGKSLIRAAVRCISHELLQNCISPKVSRIKKPFVTEEAAIRMIFAEDILRGKFDPILSTNKGMVVASMGTHREYALEKIHLVKTIYQQKCKELPTDASKEELNSMLIAMRMAG